jgi:hypothetical protein
MLADGERLDTVEGIPMTARKLVLIYFFPLCTYDRLFVSM